MGLLEIFSEPIDDAAIPVVYHASWVSTAGA